MNFRHLWTSTAVLLRQAGYHCYCSVEHVATSMSYQKGCVSNLDLLGGWRSWLRGPAQKYH